MADENRANLDGTKARRGRRPLRLAFWSVSLVAFAFVTGFGLFALHVSALDTPSTQRSADAIIVLTGGHARIDAAVELLRTGKGQRLLISGVNPLANRADLQRVSGGDDNLFNCCVDIDHAALDTIGNAQESAKWLDSHGYSSVILVTNNYHMPRSMLEMRRLDPGIELMPYPVVNARLDQGAWLTRPDAMRVIFTEYTKFIAAFARNALYEGQMPSTPTFTADTAAAKR